MSEHYVVTFVGDFFTCIVPVEQYGPTEDDDYIIAAADTIIQHVYGWSPLEHATVSVEVEHD